MAVNTLTPAELAVREDTEKQIAAGKDPYGDDEPIVPETIEQAAEKAAAAAKEADGEPDEPAETAENESAPEPDKDDPADAAEKAEPEPDPVEAKAEPAPVIEVPRLRAPSKEAMETERNRLHDEKKVARKAMMDGVMDPDDYDAIERRVTDSLLQLTVQASIAESHAQTVQLAEQNATLALIRSAKAAGTIDYMADVPAQKQFDVALNMLQADPDNAGKAYATLAQQAHETVLALRGVTKPAPAAPVDKTPAPRVPEKPPLTLRGLPNAAVSNTGGTVADSIGRLKGADYEAAFKRLTPAQKAALVDD